MAGEQGFQVQTEALDAHAATVRQVADVVEQGRSAAVTVQLRRNAYGRLCQLIPRLLEPVQDSAVSALRDAASVLQQSADDLRTTARS